MSSNHRLSTTKLLFLLSTMLPSTAFSYSVATPSSSFPYGSNAKPFGVHDFPSVTVKKDITPERQTNTDDEQQQPRTHKYDLGIGKNQPLYGGTKRRQEYASTVEFLMEHDAVNALPSPLDNDWEQLQQKQRQQQQSLSTQQETGTKKMKKRVLPIVNHVRKSQDILDIRHDHNDHNRLPHMTKKKTTKSDTSHDDSTKMDMNTAWVEMLIHTQIHPTQNHQQIA